MVEEVEMLLQIFFRVNDSGNMRSIIQQFVIEEFRPGKDGRVIEIPNVQWYEFTIVERGIEVLQRRHAGKRVLIAIAGEQ